MLFDNKCALKQSVDFLLTCWQLLTTDIYDMVTWWKTCNQQFAG